MTRHKPSNVDSAHGAPMGRPDHHTFTDQRGREMLLTVTKDAKPMTLQRVRLNNGGYDSGGAYWGIGQPLFFYSDYTGSIDGHVRAFDRADAKVKVRYMFPHAKFWR